MKNTLTKLLFLAGVILSSSTFAQKINVPGGAPNFKPSVASPLSLPPTGNAPGDARVSISNASIYIWDGAAWQGTAGGGAAMWGSIGGTLSNQTDLQTALNGKEPTITAGTALQYFRGDKTFQTLDTSAVPENGNLYFTNARFDARFGTKTTDNLTEGATSLYFTDARARAATIASTIVNGDTTHSPDGNSVFDALALKEDLVNKNQNNGYAGLDAGGKINVNQLPNTVMLFKGQWDASTNTPALADGSGSAGFVYRANVAGTANFGSGPISFQVGDWAVYNGTVWEFAANSNLVTSVNGQQGVVSLDTDDIPEGINLYYTDARARTAVIASSIVDGDTTHSPDGNSVFDALALKQDISTLFPLKAPTGPLSNPPSYGFAGGDDDTGMFSTGDGNVSVQANGILKAEFNQNTVDFYATGGTTVHGDLTATGNISAANYPPTGSTNTFAAFDNTGSLSSVPSTGFDIVGGDHEEFIQINNTGNVTNGSGGFHFTKSGDVGFLTGMRLDYRGVMGGGYGLSQVLTGSSTGQFEHINLENNGDINGNYFLINSNMSGNITSGGIFGLNMYMNGDSGNVSPVNVTNDGNTDYINIVSMQNNGDVTNGYTGLNMLNAGQTQYISALNYQNTGSQTGGYQVINIQDNPSSADSATGLNINMTGAYSSSVQGVNVDVTSATSPSKAAISANGALNIDSPLSTAGGIVPAFALNYVGGQFQVASGSPTTGEFGFGNSLATASLFHDDMPADFTSLGVGYTHVGFVGQVQVDAGKTVDTMNMALAGAGVGGGSGDITTANMYHAAGFLNQGGTVSVSKMRGFYSGSQLCAMASDCWTVFDGAGSENYLSKLAINTASNKVSSGVKFEVNGDSKLDGDVNITGVATLGNGSTATTQSANDNSTKIATTAYVDSAVAGVTTSSGYVISNISSNTTLNAATASAYFVDTTGGAVTVTLPAAASNSGKFFLVKHVAFGGANDISVARTGGDTIEGGTSDTLTSGMARKYVSNGTAWFIEE